MTMDERIERLEAADGAAIPGTSTSNGSSTRWRRAVTTSLIPLTLRSAD